MCKSSHAATRTAKAADKSTLGIGTVTAHDQAQSTFGAFHKAGETTAQCVHCVQTGTKLTLSNIPAVIQKMFGLKQTEVATFYQHPAWDKDDQLVFERNGATVDLKDFADQDVSVYVGIRTPDIAKAVDELERNALLPVEPIVDGGTVLADRELVTAK